MFLSETRQSDDNTLLLRIGDHKVDYKENYKKIPSEHVDSKLYMSKTHNVAKFLARLDDQSSKELVDFWQRLAPVGIF